MFEVQHKETGRHYVVYGVTSDKFLIFDKETEMFTWVFMFDYEPYVAVY